MSGGIRRASMRLLGLTLSTVPVIAAVLSYFPLWLSKGGTGAISGFTALLLIIAALPAYRYLRRLLESASVSTLWLFIFLLFLCLSGIAEQMKVISFIGLVGNVLGSICFKTAERIAAKEKGDE